MTAEPSTIEFYEKRPLQEFALSTRKFLPLRISNLQVDYEDGLWIVTLPPLDAAASSQDFQEARQMLLNTLTSYGKSTSCARRKSWARRQDAERSYFGIVFGELTAKKGHENLIVSIPTFNITNVCF